jgi:hypothetical protein
MEKIKCERCGEKRILFSKLICKKCIMKYRIQRKKSEDERIKLGICTCCGKNNFNKNESKRYCTNCLLRKKHFKRVEYFKNQSKSPNKKQYEESMKFLYGEQPKTI